MTAPDFSHGLAELADLINFQVGAWHDFGYEAPPAPDCATIPPLGERSAQAVKAAHGAIGTIDELTRQLSALRGQLARELRQDEEARAGSGHHGARPATAATGGEPSRDSGLLDALRAVREAIDIPRPATAGDGEAHDRVLAERVMHTVVMLRSVLEPGRSPDVPWSAAYLRDRLAEHPAEGYKTWQQLTAELEAARKSGGAR